MRQRNQVTFVVLIGLIAGLLTAAAPAGAQDAPVSDLQASHVFGQQITFRAVLSPDGEIRSASLTFQVNGSGNSIVIPAQIQADNTLTAIYETSKTDTFPAFSRLTYWFTLDYATGVRLESDRAAYTYTDNRFVWQSLSTEGRYRVHWIEGELAFGQALLDAILNARSDYSQYLDLPFPEELDIYVYPDNLVLQDALQIGHIRWAAGHADSGENTILTAIPTGFDQQLDINRQIPHEITHIRLALYMGDNYGNLPAWYSEGLASIAEQYTAPSYWQLLQSAQENDTLIPLTELCQSIPTDIKQAGLAYAQSDSFVRYLHTRYGKVGLQTLLNAYTHGLTCEGGVQAAFNTSLDRLEADWYKAAFDTGIIPRSFSQVLTWIVLLTIILAGPIVLSVAAARSKKGAKGND